MVVVVVSVLSVAVMVVVVVVSVLCGAFFLVTVSVMPVAFVVVVIVPPTVGMRVSGLDKVVANTYGGGGICVKGLEFSMRGAHTRAYGARNGAREHINFACLRLDPSSPTKPLVER